MFFSSTVRQRAIWSHWAPWTLICLGAVGIRDMAGSVSASTFTMLLQGGLNPGPPSLDAVGTGIVAAVGCGTGCGVHSEWGSFVHCCSSAPVALHFRRLMS